MLTQVIANAAAQAAAIGRMPDLPGAGHTARAQVAAFEAEILPLIAGTQKSVAAFARDAGETVADLLRRASGPGAPLADQLRRALDPIARLAQQAEAQSTTAQSRCQNARAEFARDRGELLTAQTQARARLAGANAQLEHWRQEAEKLRTRSTATTIVGIFFPLVKLGDEIASLIQYRKSTEGALSDASRQAAEAAHETASLDALANQFGALEALMGQLVGGVQYLANAMSFVTATLTDEAGFVALTTPVTAGLFLRALETSVGHLAQEAA
jgi:hypothetical protein